jgi:uncharacterized protein (TIGR04255 family)
MSQNLPKFNKPPIIETALGVEFESLSNFLVPHFGAFLLELKGSYNKFQQLPPIHSQIEKFEEDQNLTNSFEINLSSRIRCLFLNSTEDWRLQIQNDRFLSNWVKNKAIYPSYEETLRRFKTNWNKFGLFLEKSKIEKPKIKQCEVTYLNHIEDNVEIDKWTKIFPLLADNIKGEEFLPYPEGIAINTVYHIPEKRGRLYIEMKPAFRHLDARNIIVLSLTARVIPLSSKRNDVLDALNLGHEWIVRGFTDFTSKEMHKIWERI